MSREPPAVLFADADPSDLCSARPPLGLLGAGRNDTLAHCIAYAQILLRAANNGTHPRTPLVGGRCAIVGNSGSLLGDRRGSRIDHHDSVLRFNAAPSGGVWASDVGSKSTVRILSSWVAKMRTWHRNDTRATGDTTLLYCQSNWVGGCVHRGIHPSSAALGQARRWLINPAFVRHVRDMLVRSAHAPARPHTVLPSAGLLGVAIALRSCTRLTVVGFGNVSTSNSTTSCEHYYECALSGGRLASEGRCASTEGAQAFRNRSPRALAR